MSPLPLGILASSGAGAPPAFELIETVLITSNTASVTFNNLNTYTDYANLHFRVVLKSSNATANNTNYLIRLNNDTSTTYGRVVFNGTGGATNSSVSNGQTSIEMTELLNGFTTAGHYSPSMVDIIDFKSGEKVKTIRGWGVSPFTETDTTMIAGYWNSVAAITSVTFTSNSLFFVNGSRLSMYGIRG